MSFLLIWCKSTEKGSELQRWNIAKFFYPYEYFRLKFKYILKEISKHLIDSASEIASFLAMTKIPYENACPSPDRSGNPFVFFL